MKTVSARKRSRAGGGIDLKIMPFGPTADQMRTLAERVAKHRAVQALLGRTRHRLLRIDLIDLDAEAKPAARRPLEGFRAIFYDYTTERPVVATGALGRPSSLEVTESAVQPLPSRDEFDEAARPPRHAKTGSFFETCHQSKFRVENWTGDEAWHRLAALAAKRTRKLNNDMKSWVAVQSALAKRSLMTARKKLEQEVHQLAEIIKATCQALDSRTLADARREQLRTQVDLRVAARKHILKRLWVMPKLGAGESRPSSMPQHVTTAGRRPC